MSHTTITAIAAICITTQALAEPMKFPNRFALAMAQHCVYPEYFRCDYTSRTCLKGRGDPALDFVGVVLAEDRQTVIRHIWTGRGVVTDFDAGTTTYPGDSSPRQMAGPDNSDDDVRRAQLRCGPGTTGKFLPQ